LHPQVATEESAKRRQLSLWDELDLVHELVVGTAHSRMTACQQLWIPRGEANPDLTWKRSEHGSWSSCDLASCNAWGCPRCGRARASSSRDELGAVILKHLDASTATDAWMLTLTAPHYDAGVELDVRRLYDASALLWRDLEFKRWASRWGVVGRVRFLDNTRGAHPHFHIALLVEHAVIGLTSPIKAMGAVERATWLESIAAELVPVWERACRAAGVDIRDPDAFERHALKLTGGERAAAYFAGWGLTDEVTLASYKRGSHLELLADVRAGVAGAGDTYVAWLDATRGRQWCSGLADARRAIGVTDEDVERYAEARREALRKKKPRELVNPLTVRIPAELVQCALRIGWKTVLLEADQADASGVSAQRAVLSLLWRAELAARRWRRSRPPPA
jgi:hypothetical protein